MEAVSGINNLVQLAQLNQLLHQQLLQKAQNTSVHTAQTVQSLGNSATTFGGINMNMNLNNFSQLCKTKLGSLQSLPLNSLPTFAAPNQSWQIPSQQQLNKILQAKLSVDLNMKTTNTNKSNEQPLNLKRARMQPLQPLQDENFNLMNLENVENSMNYFNKKDSLFSRTKRLGVDNMGLGAKSSSVYNGNLIKPEPLIPHSSNKNQSFPFRVSPGDSCEKNNVKVENRGYKGKRVKLTREESNKCLEFLDNKKSSKKPKNFVCKYPGCKRKFSWKWSMETHARTHQGDSARVYKCKHCDKGFFTVGCLKSHTKIHTRKPGGFVCEAEGCGKKYSTSEGLRLHTRNHHQVDKKWKCMVPGCSRAFVRQADLRLHVIRIHSLERPFPCPIEDCKKGFACASELKRHLLVHKKKDQDSSLMEKVTGKEKEKGKMMALAEAMVTLNNESS